MDVVILMKPLKKGKIKQQLYTYTTKTINKVEEKKIIRNFKMDCLVAGRTAFEVLGCEQTALQMAWKRN